MNYQSLLVRELYYFNKILKKKKKKKKKGEKKKVLPAYNSNSSSSILIGRWKKFYRSARNCQIYFPSAVSID